MGNDILGCIIPNKKEHFVGINERRLLTRPYEHWKQTHELDEGSSKKKMKIQVPKMNTFFGIKSTSTSTTVDDKPVEKPSSSTTTSIYSMF